MTQSPPPQYPDQQEEGGVKGALTRQLGPLKTWQWGLVIVGAVVIYRLFKGGGDSSPSVSGTVPFTSTGDGLNANNGSNPAVIHIPKIKKTIAYYTAVLTKRTPIWNSKGKIIGYFGTGRKVILGKRVKIKGKWYFTILNMPGKYIRDSSVDQQPVYNEQIEPTSALTPVSLTMAAPITTAESVQSFLAQTSAASSDTLSQPTVPTIDKLATNGISITAPAYTRL